MKNKANLAITASALLALAGATISNDASAQSCGTGNWNGGETNGAGLTAGSPDAVRRFSGPCGLLIEPSGTPTYVTDNSPSAESSYNARFYVFLSDGDLGLSASDTFTVFQGFDADAGAGNTQFSVDVTANGSNSYNFVLNSGGASSNPITVSELGWHAVEVRWSTSDASADEIVVNGSASETVSDTGNASIESVELGYLAGVSPTTLHVDDFVSRRSEVVGTLQRCDTSGDADVSVSDVIAIAQEAVNISLANGQPDCNNDGSISVSDVIAAARIAVNIDPLP